VEGVNGITVTLVPWSRVDACLAVLRHSISEIRLILVK